MNAVSDAATAAARRCIAGSSRRAASGTMPARLPIPGVRVKASTMAAWRLMAGAYHAACLAPVGVHNRANGPLQSHDMIHGLPPEHVALLCLAAFCGGTVDAIAGGVGLITLPALLAAGLSPHQALGTNKGQSSFGSFAAIIRYGREKFVDWKLAAIAFPLGFLGSALGAILALHLRPG